MLLAILGLTIVGAWLLAVEFVPVVTMKMRFASLESLILDYANKHDSLPKSLDDLENVRENPRMVNDIWGRRIAYEVDGKRVTLTSTGKQGSETSQLIAIFDAKDKDGRWKPPNGDDWVKRPE